MTPYLVDERRTMPAKDAHICASCQFSTGEDCCARYRARYRARSRGRFRTSA